jgi:hypothetical protein
MRTAELTTREPAGISCTTTVLAPITTSSPTTTSPITIAPAPTYTPSPSTGYPAERPAPLAPTVTPCAIEQFAPNLPRTTMPPKCAMWNPGPISALGDSRMPNNTLTSISSGVYSTRNGSRRRNGRRSRCQRPKR